MFRMAACTSCTVCKMSTRHGITASHNAMCLTWPSISNVVYEWEVWNQLEISIMFLNIFFLTHFYLSVLHKIELKLQNNQKLWVIKLVHCWINHCIMRQYCIILLLETVPHILLLLTNSMHYTVQYTLCKQSILNMWHQLCPLK